MAATVSIAILANAAQAKRELKSTTAEVDKAAKQWRKASDSMKSLVTGLAVGAIGGGVIEFLKDSTTAASDFQQTVAKSTVIFGDQQAAVQDWSKSAATAFGLSQNAALAAAAQFGNMFSQLGIARGQSIKMSESMVKLAADLGAFNHVPTADVLESIQAGFRGEYDSLQRLLPGVSAARIQHEALALAGKKSASALTAADNAMAFQSIIAKDSANATGAWARSTDTLAGKQATLAAAFNDAKVEFGTALMPVVTDAMKRLTDLTSEASKHAKDIGKIVDFVIGALTTPWVDVLIASYAAMAALVSVNATVTGAWAIASKWLVKTQLELTAATASAATAATVEAEAQAAAALATRANAFAAEMATFAEGGLATATGVANGITFNQAVAQAAASVAAKETTAAIIAEADAAIAAQPAMVGLTTLITDLAVALAGLAAGYGLGTILNNKLGLSDHISDGLDKLRDTLHGTSEEARDAQQRAEFADAKLQATLAKHARDARAWIDATRGGGASSLMTDAQAVAIYDQALHGGVARVKEWMEAQKQKTAATKAATAADKEAASIAGSNAYRRINDAAIRGMQALKKQLDEATQKVEDLKASQAQYAQTLSSLLTGDITSIPLVRAIASLDGRSVSVTTGVAGFTKGLAARLKAAKDFVANMARLKAEGVNADILSQIANAGPDQGGKLAKALATATPAQVAEINRLQGTLTSTANRFGKDFAAKIYDPQIAAAQATVVKLQQQSVAAVNAWIKSLADLWDKGGTKLAEQLYQSGVSIADGLVDGIASQKSVVTQQAEDLANWMLTIRALLGIASPSKVFHGIGQNVGLSLVGGLDSTQTAVRAGMTRLSSSLVNGVAPALPSLTLLPGGKTTGNTYNLNVAVPVNADAAETGRQVIKAIEAHERSSGVRRLAS